MKKTVTTIAAMVIAASNGAIGGEQEAQGVYAGVNLGNFALAEAGYVFGRTIPWAESESIKAYGGLGLGMEQHLGGRNITGLKMSYTINMFVSFGASAVYYTDYNEGTLRFRPEIGVAMFGFRLVYGRNVTVFNYDFPGVNRDNVALTYFYPLP